MISDKRVSPACFLDHFLEGRIQPLPSAGISVYIGRVGSTVAMKNTGERSVLRRQPFSEPETQALRKICEENNFKTAMNFHAFGSMLTHPYNWANTDLLPAVDKDVYQEIAQVFRWKKFGTAIQTVGYTATGESDDWMYSKRHIISMSPEVGPESGGFWPPSSQIAGINSRNFERTSCETYRDLISRSHKMTTFQPLKECTDVSGKFMEVSPNVAFALLEPSEVRGAQGRNGVESRSCALCSTVDVFRMDWIF
eukprot:Skav217575  [mRNA]  locus=scaffold129:140816:144846:- [translate_table: standard]